MDFKIEDKSIAFIDELERRARRVMRRTGERAVLEAQGRCPVSKEIRVKYRGKDLSGDDLKHLRDTISYKLEAQKGLALDLKMGATKFTAHFQELGTETMEARPFINPAMRAAADDFDYALATEAEKIKL